MKIRGLRTQSCPGIDELIIGRIDSGNLEAHRAISSSVKAPLPQLMGRWSRLVGETFLDWRDVPNGLRWLDVFSVCEKLVSLAHVVFVSLRFPRSDVRASYARISCVKDVRFGSKADMCSAKRHFRFTPESGHETAPIACPPNV